MDLSEYAESLRRELTAITRFAGDDIARAAEMLSETLDSTVRLALLDVLSAAADEITASLDGATVDVRLTGTEPEFVVNMTRTQDAATPEPAETGDEAGNTRVTLRISDSMKARVEAAALSAGLSVNAWLVRAISRALDSAPGGSAGPGGPGFGGPGGPKKRPPFPPSPPGKSGSSKRYTGFARS
jgi:HicB family